MKEDARVRFDKHGRAVVRKPYHVRFDCGLANVLRRLKVRSKDGTTMVTLREYYGQNISLHHFRVFFIAQAVMAGVDLFTIAQWVGHVSTKMILEIYGRVSTVHRAAQALKLHFLPHTIGRAHSVPQHMEKSLLSVTGQTAP